MPVAQHLLPSINTDSLVTPGSTTLDSGSGNFTVPHYNTLIEEVWGGGGSGCSNSGTTSFQNYFPGKAGNTSTSGSITCTGGGGGPANTGSATGGVASGGNTTNTNGNTSGGPGSGFGAGAPNGGAQVNCNTGIDTQASGNIPGGGGPGARNASSVPCPGGASGAYAKSIYMRGVTAGAPDAGDTIPYSVGAGVTPTSSVRTGGAGAHGRVKYTWS